MVEKLILHAGTPKTGTTSLQVYLHRHRAALVKKGILYPPTWDPDMKHQWMVPALLAPDGGSFRRRVERLVMEAEPDTRTLVLSTEGLFNHWWDFSPAGRDALASLRELLPVSVWIWFREPVSFVTSYYVQMLTNPRGYVPCYGRDLSVDDMLDDQWFAKHLDYIGFVRDVEALLGGGTVVPFSYRDNTVSTFLDALGVQHRHFVGLNKRRTVGKLGVRLLRFLNRRDIPNDHKHRGVRLIGQLDRILRPVSGPLSLAPATERRIRILASESADALQSEYGLTIKPLVARARNGVLVENT